MPSWHSRFSSEPLIGLGWKQRIFHDLMVPQGQATQPLPDLSQNFWYQNVCWRRHSFLTRHKTELGETSRGYACTTALFLSSSDSDPYCIGSVGRPHQFLLGPSGPSLKGLSHHFANYMGYWHSSGATSYFWFPVVLNMTLRFCSRQHGRQAGSNWTQVRFAILRRPPHVFYQQYRTDKAGTYPPRHFRPDWPPESSIKSLVDKSSGHFLYASTVIRYIENVRDRPEKRLEMLWSYGRFRKTHMENWTFCISAFSLISKPMTWRFSFLSPLLSLFVSMIRFCRHIQKRCYRRLPLADNSIKIATRSSLFLEHLQFTIYLSESTEPAIDLACFGRSGSWSYVLTKRWHTIHRWP